jgi:hypothetical protein
MPKEKEVKKEVKVEAPKIKEVAKPKEIDSNSTEAYVEKDSNSMDGFIEGKDSN